MRLSTNILFRISGEQFRCEPDLNIQSGALNILADRLKPAIFKTVRILIVNCKMLCVKLRITAGGFNILFGNITSLVNCLADCLCNNFPTETDSLPVAVVFKNQFKPFAVMI